MAIGAKSWVQSKVSHSMGLHVPGGLMFPLSMVQHGVDDHSCFCELPLVGAAVCWRPSLICDVNSHAPDLLLSSIPR